QRRRQYGAGSQRHPGEHGDGQRLQRRLWRRGRSECQLRLEIRDERAPWQRNLLVERRRAQRQRVLSQYAGTPALVCQRQPVRRFSRWTHQEGQGILLFRHGRHLSGGSVAHPVNLPTVPFETAVIANLNAVPGLSLSVPFYQQAFALFNGVSQKGAQPLPGGGCSDVAAAGITGFGTSNPCAVLVQAGPLGHTHDLIYIGRYDQNIGSKDSIFVRVVHEHGQQDTYVDPISSNFNVTSDQPQWQSQVQQIHVFSPAKVNVFNASLLWYSAYFFMQNPAAAITSFPGSLIFGDGSLGTPNGALNVGNWQVPQGRSTTQYQFTDDFSWTHGRHSLRFGASFRRADVSDRTFLYATPLILEASLS